MQDFKLLFIHMVLNALDWNYSSFLDSQLRSSYMFYYILTDLASEKQNTLLERCIVQNYM